VEGSIPEIFYHDGVDSSRSEGSGVCEGCSFDRIEVTGEPW
jgi:hypothetical protein